MKPIRLFVRVVLTTGCLCLATQAFSAQEAPSPGMDEARKAKVREKILQKFDTNGDGKLDDAEKAALRSAAEGKAGGAGGRKKLMEKFDTNGDGRLDDAERAAVRELIRQKKSASGG